MGTLRAFDTLALTPHVLVTYGARYARYDYLEDSSLLSPRADVTLIPAEHRAHQRSFGVAPRGGGQAQKNSSSLDTGIRPGCRRSGRSRRSTIVRR